MPYAIYTLGHWFSKKSIRDFYLAKIGIIKDYCIFEDTKLVLINIDFRFRETFI
tara:strand:+ start:1530 stop:1691 length:162 start_codon:yes stop_codon:yes gene_type:complete